MGGLSVFLVFFGIIVPAPTFGLPTVQCAQTGAYPFGINVWNWKCRPGGAISIGVKKYEAKYCGAIFAAYAYANSAGTGRGIEHLFNTSFTECPYRWDPETVRRIQLCDHEDKFAKMRVHPVQQTDSKGKKQVLSGWLHIEVELVDPSDSIRMIYAQVNDENFNSIGEFVTDPADQCESSNPEEVVSPSPYQYIPCNAIGAREAKPSQALYMVAQEDLYEPVKNPATLPTKDLKTVRGIHFTWRLSEYWCNRHIRFRPEIFILTTKNIDVWKGKTKEGINHNSWTTYGNHFVWRKMPNMWLRANWIGAADIKHPGRGSLQCNQLINDKTEKISEVAPWLMAIHNNSVKDDYYHISRLGWNTQVGRWEVISCQPYFIKHAAVRDENTFPTFAGRCNIDKRGVLPETGSIYPQTCNMDKNAPEFDGLNINFETYRHYLKLLNATRRLYCNQPCRPPKSEPDLKEILAVNITKIIVDPGVVVGFSHENRTSESIAKFWKGRKYHGALAILVTMFLTPVSFFLSRYYKETFMKLQFKDIHIWYWLHVGFTFSSIALHGSSQSAMVPNIQSFGRSQSPAAKLHFTLGWSAHLVFILITLFGGVRGIYQGTRIFLMTLHSIAGFAQYVMSIMLILISTQIPASPSIAACGDVDGLPTGTPLVAVLAAAWLLLDIFFHISMTLLQKASDARRGITRRWFCPITPFLASDSHSDLKGAPFRKLVLVVYLLLSGGITVFAILFIISRPQMEMEDCVFGEMSCKAIMGCSKAAIAVCKKAGHPNCDV